MIFYTTHDGISYLVHTEVGQDLTRFVSEAEPAAPEPQVLPVAAIPRMETETEGA